MSFDIDLLINNQREYIKTNLSYWEERYPDTVALMRKRFPTENIEQALDSFIKDSFYLLNLTKFDNVVFGTMKGPVDIIAGVPSPSRPSKLRGNLLALDVINTYVASITNIIRGNVKRLDEQNIPYIYYFSMWIPIYGVNTSCGCGLMTHYGQRVER